MGPKGIKEKLEEDITMSAGLITRFQTKKIKHTFQHFVQR